MKSTVFARMNLMISTAAKVWTFQIRVWTHFNFPL